MGRPSKWNSETESIRLPKHAIEQCLKLAQMLDEHQGKSFVQNLDPVLVTVDDERFLIQPEPLTLGELAEVDRMYEDLMAKLKAAGLNKREHRMIVFSELVKAWGRKLN